MSTCFCNKKHASYRKLPAGVTVIVTRKKPNATHPVQTQILRYGLSVRMLDPAVSVCET